MGRVSVNLLFMKTKSTLDIEKEGIEINDFTLLKRNEMRLLEKWFTSKSPDLKAAGNFHIVYPANERSGWICCCAD